MNKQVGYCCTDIYCDYCHGTGIDQSRNDDDDADNSTPYLITLGDETVDFLLVERLESGDLNLRSNVKTNTQTQSLFDLSMEMVEWIHEDELPDSYPYDFGYALSRIEDGVRVFPNVKPNESETP